jgi:hypothetical protein
MVRILCFEVDRVRYGLEKESTTAELKTECRQAEGEAHVLNASTVPSMIRLSYL